jgi:hypothetical protein
LRRKFVQPPSQGIFGGSENTGTQATARPPFHQLAVDSFEEDRSITPPADKTLESSGDQRSATHNVESDYSGTDVVTKGLQGKQEPIRSRAISVKQPDSIEDELHLNVKNQVPAVSRRHDESGENRLRNEERAAVARAIYKLEKKELQSGTGSNPVMRLAQSDSTSHSTEAPWPYFDDQTDDGIGAEDDEETIASISTPRSCVPVHKDSCMSASERKHPQNNLWPVPLKPVLHRDPESEPSRHIQKELPRDADLADYIPLPDQGPVISYLKRTSAAAKKGETQKHRDCVSQESSAVPDNLPIKASAHELRKRREPFVKMQAARLSGSPTDVMGLALSEEENRSELGNSISSASEARQTAQISGFNTRRPRTYRLKTQEHSTRKPPKLKLNQNVAVDPESPDTQMPVKLDLRKQGESLVWKQETPGSLKNQARKQTQLSNRKVGDDVLTSHSPVGWLRDSDGSF